MRLLSICATTLLLFWHFQSSVAFAFLSPFVVVKTGSTRLASSTTSSHEVLPFRKLDRVVQESLPIVYCYDHCPFCVRVRLALGVKNVKHSLYFLANDDVDTPTQLVGKKIAPIFASKQEDNKDRIMTESMDIVRYIDQDERFGPTHAILPASDRTDLQAWQSSTRDLLRGLQRPRYVATGLLPEFQQLDARHAFVKNHAMPPYSKDEWKAMPTDEQLLHYADAMARDPAHDIEELNRKLVELDDIVYSEHHCTEGGFSYDDIDLFSRLRSITIIKDVEWPEKLRKYMDNMAELADIPLYDEMAL